MRMFTTAVMLLLGGLAPLAEEPGRAGVGYVQSGGATTLTEELTITLVDFELGAEGADIAAVDGAESDFDTLTIPESGYADTVRVDRTSLAVVRLPDGRIAKLKFNASSYRPDGETPNTRGFQVTFQVSSIEGGR